jgi:hypothetical protein
MVTEWHKSILCGFKNGFVYVRDYRQPLQTKMYTSRANPIGYTPSGGDNSFAKFQERERAEKLMLRNENDKLCREVFEELMRNDRGFTKDQINQVYIVCWETSAKLDKGRF